MQPKILLIVTEPAGWNILDSPRPQSSGAIRRRAEVVGKPILAYRIILVEGVPYAWLVPQDPNKVEWGRVSEKGGVLLDDKGNFKQQMEGVKAYVRVEPLETTDENILSLTQAISELANANTLLATTLRELARK